MRFIISIFIFIILMIAFSMFASVNDVLVSVNYLLGRLEMPLSNAMLITFLFGLLAGIALILFDYFKLKMELKIHKSKLTHKEQEIVNLRALPAKDGL